MREYLMIMLNFLYLIETHIRTVSSRQFRWNRGRGHNICFFMQIQQILSSLSSRAVATFRVLMQLTLTLAGQ